MKPEYEGTGGGYGKYKGLTIAEIERLFAKAIEEGNMRSLSAVLRIAHEQLEARGSLGQTRGLAIVFAVMTLSLFTAETFMSGSARGSVERVAWGTSAAFIATMVGVLNTHRATRLAIIQERAIRELALDALLTVVRNPGFKPKPLHRDQERLLQDMLRRSKRSEPELMALIEG